MTGISGKPNIPLREARARGDKFYIPTFSCQRGHMSKRFTGSGACCECCQIINEANRKKYRAGPNGDAFRAKKAAELANWYTDPFNLAKRKIYAQRDMDKFGPRTKDFEHGRADTARLRAKKLGCEGSYTGQELRDLLIKCDYKCMDCGENVDSKYEADHKVPLRVGGSNYISNIQILCMSCNRSKGCLNQTDWETVKKRRNLAKA